MKVRLTTDRAGWNWQQFEGEIHDLPQEEAMALLAANQAEVIEDDPKPPVKRKK